MSYINRFDGRWNFLSNFHPVEIEYQGIKYPSVEHYYVAQKCKNDQMINGVYYTTADFKEMIARMPNPGSVKKIGQKMKIRTDWESKKLEIMNWGVREKFKNDYLADLLLSTEDLELIEGNYWHDNFWGSCYCEKCENKGKNNLGKILMKVRDELRGIEKKTGLEQFFK
jgi:ribA/ribD-fused uncharacterized protein